jgi:N-[(2S)-2-amino-2-carboxyethyl]-L-glutamate dehydrogenase
MDSNGKDFAVVGGKTIHRLLHEDLEGCVRIVREAYLAHDAGDTVNPQSVFLRFPERPDARIIGLPAHLRRPRPLSGIKWIASYPANIRSGTPRASAVLILNDGASGYPFACLEGAVISAARTAASAALAADVIRGGHRKLASLGVVGAGNISRYVLTFLCGLRWEIGTVHVHDIDPAAQIRFAEWLAAVSPDTKTTTAPGAEAVLAASDMTLFATVSSAPYVRNPDALAHCPTVLHLSLRDLAPELVLSSSNVVDDPQHVLSAGTSLALAMERCGNQSFITCTLADLLLRRRELAANKPTIFSPFGLGMLDLSVGEWIYRRAADSRELMTAPDFFMP